jgi:hypothetical protein
MEETTVLEERSSNGFRETLAFYHPIRSGKGMALRLDLRLNEIPGGRYNCYFMEMACQKSPSQVVNGQRFPATFDWENKVTVKLDFHDVSAMICVLEDRVESLSQRGDGLYHQNGDSDAIISLKRSSETPGFIMGISKRKKGENQFRGHFQLSIIEAEGLRQIFKTSLFLLAFGRDPGCEMRGGGAAEL